MLDPTLINRTMTPDEVLRAMLPVVREAFARPVVQCSRETLHRSFKGNTPRTYSRPDVTWAMIFAAHVLSALMELASETGAMHTVAQARLYSALTAFRDAWCAAAEGAGNTKED